MVTTNLLNLHSLNEANIEKWHHFLDINIPISIEIGRTKMTLEAILALEPESIIQLPRSTGEGVDIIVGDRYIGSGEIVTIEEHSAIRIKELVSAPVV